MNQRRKPGFWTYLSALSCMAATVFLACGTDSTPANNSSGCSLGGGRCPLGCSDTLGCVQCAANADCRNGLPICVLGQCAECATTADCNAGAVCEPATHTCAAPCATNADCVGGGGPGGGNAPTCDTATKTCVGCTAATEATVCTGTRTRCDLNRMQCSVCLSRSDCGVATPACDTQNGNCVQCLIDSDCTGANACGTDHLCHPICLSNANCTNPARPVCDTATGACGECVANTDCAANANNLHVCNTENHNCVACLANTDCAATPATPVCQTRNNQCVACTANSDCPAATPICRAPGGGIGGGRLAQCVQCETNANCTANAALPICDVQTGLCVQCQTNADCGAATPTCTNGTCGA